MSKKLVCHTLTHIHTHLRIVAGGKRDGVERELSEQKIQMNHHLTRQQQPLHADAFQTCYIFIPKKYVNLSRPKDAMKKKFLIKVNSSKPIYTNAVWVSVQSKKQKTKSIKQDKKKMCERWNEWVNEQTGKFRTTKRLLSGVFECRAIEYGTV